MEIYLIRHGATAGTERSCFNGSTDEPLSPAGRGVLCPAEFIPQRVFVTPLQRTAQTADILFPGVCQTVVPELREMDFGVFEGRNHGQLADDPVYQRWLDSGCELPCPQGEQKVPFSARCCAAFGPMVEQALREGRPELTCVLHGGVLMALMEGFARPERPYFDWDTEPGTGFLLHADPQLWAQERRLEYLRPLCFTHH